MRSKYELLLDDTIEIFGRKLFRIKALISFGSVAKGDLGGYVEADRNLSHSGNASVYGDAEVKSSKDYIVFKNTWSSFRWFTYTKSNKMWSVGCFYGTGQELVKKAYEDSEKSGKCYEAYVNLVLDLEKIEEEKQMNAIGMYSILERLDRLEKIVFETVDDTSDILTRLRNLEKAVLQSAEGE